MSKNNKRINWDDLDLIQQAISKSTSRTDTLRTLGYVHSTSSMKKLNDIISRFNLDVSSFTTNAHRWAVLPDIINDCTSLPNLLEKLNVQNTGGNRTTAKRYITKYNLNIEHFNTKSGKRKYKYENLFCENCLIHRGTVKDYILHDALIEYKCSKCDNDGTWLNEKLVLQLEHINGVNNDNRLENLTFLCPNCHTQTSTYGGRKRKNNRV